MIQSLGKLVIRQDGQPAQEITLAKPVIKIGREPDNDVVLNNPQVSRHHAQLRFDGRMWVVENLSNSNPVRIQGQPLAGPLILPNGGQFELGYIVVQLLEAPAPVQTQPQSQNVSQFQTFAPQPSRVATPGWQQGGVGETMVAADLAPTLKVAHDGTIQEYTLTKPSYKIGRAPDNDIIIPISTVSRLHAILTKHGADYVIIDQHSANGLLYKGGKITERQLEDEDIIRIGDELGNVATLTYQDASRPAAAGHKTVMLEPLQQIITIGRAPDNALVLNYPAVSAHHAVIQRMGGQAMLQDLGSTNGTFVRGQRVLPNRPVPISQGETIQIASYPLIYRDESLAQVDGEKVRLDALGVRKVVGNNLVLLHDISLSIQPKEFVALVGGSGAGKSTLMDALNGFRPATDGKVLLNGEDYYHNFAAYRSSLGYVPQDDIIHRELPVERALYFAAKLRLPKDTTDAEIEQRVAEVLEDVDMTQRRKVEVSRLSGGQRKRVSIAVELLAKPHLFFLDEPTSGLDPGLDKRMMFLLRRLADQGRTIVLVTHATSNITACDKVVFLAPGGHLCFFGPPQEALKFFEVKEFADIYSKLEQTPESGIEWETLYRQSPYYQQYVSSRLVEVARQPLVGQDRQPTSGYGAADGATPTATRAKAPKMSPWRQFGLLTRRYAELTMRDKINLLVLILQAPIIGIILALVAGNGIFADGKSPGDAQKVLFMLAIAAVWLGTSNAAREITKETPVYLRERLVNLGVFPYVMSKVAVLTLLCILQSLLLTGIVLLRTGTPPEGAFLPAALELIIGVWLTTMGGLAMGLMVSALATNTDKAISIVPILLVPQIILAGLIFPLSGPSQVLSYVTVAKWSIDSLGTSSNLNRLYYQNVAGAPPGINPASVPNVGNYDPNNYDDNPSDKKEYTSQAVKSSLQTHLLGRWGILVGMIVIFLGLTCYFQKRKDKAWQQKKK